MPSLPTAEPGRPAPVGALAAATVRELERPVAIAMVVGLVAGVASIPAALGVYEVLGQRPSLVVTGLAGMAGYLVAVLIMAMLPALALPGRSRSALAAHVWLGAREFERALGSRHAARSFPTKPGDMPEWLLTHPETDATRGMHVELHLMRGDVASARATIERMQGATPSQRFDRALLAAMAEYQSTGNADDTEAREAMRGIVDPLEGSMASVALAAFEARRRLPEGDWREPLLRARPSISETDAAILTRDFGWVNFVTLVRRTWIVLLFLLALTLGIGIPVDLATR